MNDILFREDPPSDPNTHLFDSEHLMDEKYFSNILCDLPQEESTPLDKNLVFT